jgi:hypothetical protein
MTIVHVHVEKTAGTTLKSAYINAYGGDRVWGYSASEQAYRALGKKLFAIDSDWQQSLRAQIFRNTPRLARLGQLALNALPSHQALTLEQVQEVASVIIGHFTFDGMSQAIDPGQSAYRAVLRDPLDRMRSHYSFLLQRSVPKSRMRIAALDAENMSFEEFALQPSVQNFQSQAIGDSLTPYEMVGVVDYLDLFMAAAGAAASERQGTSH